MSGQLRPRAGFRVGLVDRYEDDQLPGQVVGREVDGHRKRGGRDVEGIIGIDHGALRIQTPKRPGWGKHGVDYGPFERENGLTFLVLILNGHHASQTYGAEKSRVRLLVMTLLSKLMRRGARFFPARLLQTIYASPDFASWPQGHSWPPIRDNLVLGWFSSPTAFGPKDTENAIRIRSLGVRNGMLLGDVGKCQAPLLTDLPNIPFAVLIMLRKRGAAYYFGFVPDPVTDDSITLRPIAIDTDGSQKSLYAAISQNVLGEIGFSVDTRVYRTEIFAADSTRWYGSAQIADSLLGKGSLEQRDLETGQRWSVVQGEFRTTERGVRAFDERNLAVVKAGSPSGLLHAVFDLRDRSSLGGVVWRYQNDRNHWGLLVGARKAQLYVRLDGVQSTVLFCMIGRLLRRGDNALQVIDSGCEIVLYLNGMQLFGKRIRDDRLAGSLGLGLVSRVDGPGPLFKDFEAHPRLIHLPNAEGRSSKARRIKPVLEDDFSNGVGPLEGREAVPGGPRWARQIGKGRFCVQPDWTVKVMANARKANPGRTAYTIPWGHPNFAELEAEIIAPGSLPGQGEKGRAGLIFFQDEGNYLIVNTYLDDFAVGKSISGFFRCRGEETERRAVWTNVGKGLDWGARYRLRVNFDGERFLAFLDGNAVLYRAVQDVYPEANRIRINRVGMAVNWEFGNDTGSRFSRFIAFRRQTIH